MPIGHGRAGPDDSKLRDDPGVLLGRGATAAFRRVDGSYGPTSSSSPSPLSSSSSPLPPATTANPACLNLASPNAKSIKYGVPNTESTIETLHHVNYKDYQLSMYPTGNTPPENNGEESIIWKAPSAQDPSFQATNAAAQLNGQKDLFISGVLWGIVGGAGVASVDHLYEAYRERKERLPSRRNEL